MKNEKKIGSWEWGVGSRDYFFLPILLTFFTFLFSLFTSSCDLINGPVQPDFLEKIDAKIAWSNAARLAVRIDYPSEWGSSNPAAGPIAPSPMDIRQSYAFELEFNVLPGYGFEEWLAFPTSTYNDLDKAKTANEVKSISLNGRGVDITGGVNAAGAQTAIVTINVTDPVTIVPWCGNRPRLSTRTNPPLNPIQTAFPYDQRVNIWFSMNVKRSTVALGESILVTGVNLADSPTHGSRGEPFHGDGDLTAYFDMEFPDDNNDPDGLVDRVTLVPVADTASNLALLSISVKVGPGIENESGTSMAQAETISYQTDSRQAQKAYRAAGIAAQKADWFEDTATYPWNSPSIDRRFNLSANTVPIRFAVEPPEGVPSTPNRITIIEQRAYNLSGFDASGQIPTEYQNIIPSGGSYRIDHQLKMTDSGIIQLLVLPWYYDAASIIHPLDINTAIFEGQFVSIVIDNAPPNLSSLGAGLNDPSSKESGTGIYTYGEGKEIILTLAELANLVDNGTQGGIPASLAWGTPWTMDDVSKLFWHVRIGEESQTETKTSPRLPVYNGQTLNNSWKPDTITGFTAAAGYRVYIKFEDSIGNISLDWIDTGFRIKYSSVVIETVSALRAVCNTAGNSINVTWTQPGVYLYPEIIIRQYRTGSTGDVFENETRHDFNKEKAGSYAIIPASGVTGYEIKINTHNEAGTAETPSIWVYNIPGMDVTETNTVRVLSSEQLTVSSEQLAKNIILTRDITILGNTPHTPIGTATAPFAGKFYGNGHTITINGISNTVHAGLFGYTNNALIRDLTVAYNTNIASNTAIQYLGGVTGYAAGSTEITNIVTSGSLDATLGYAGNKYVGGIAGYMANTVTIANIHAGLDLDCTATGSNNVFFGGIMGDTATGGTSTRTAMTAVSVTGALTHKQAGGTMYAGGVAGRFQVGVSVDDIEFSGSFSVIKTGTGETNTGGILGYASAGFFSDCRMNGSIEIPGTHSSGGAVNVGGLLGNSNSASVTSLTIGSSSATGYISCYKTGNGDLNCGGLIGLANLLTLKDCWFGGPGSISVGSSTGPINLGGAVGNANGAVFNNCRSLARNVSAESSEPISIGGFIGRFYYGEIIASYARTEVDARGGDVIQAGGFAGTISPTTAIDTTISQCYATGNVDITSTGNFPNAGGLIGVFEQSVDGDLFLTDSYSLGNVSVKCGMRAYAGGLVGHIGTTGSARDSGILNCFAAGNVSAISTGTGAIDNRSFSGGLVARITNQAAVSGAFTMKNNAALGDSVTIMTTYNDKIIGRVYSVAYTYDNRTTTVTNNYAKDSMRVEVSNDYNTYFFPLRVGTAPLPYYTLPNITAANINANLIHGLDASASTFRNSAFWRDTLEYNSDIWDFNTCTSRGYPTLKEVGGQ